MNATTALRRLFVALVFTNGVSMIGHAQDTYAYSDRKKATYEPSHSNGNSPQQTNNKETLFNVLKDLNKTKGAYFLFSDPELGNRPVNVVPPTDEPIEKILDKVLKNTGLRYKKVSDNAFVILNEKEKDKKAKDASPINFSGEIDPLAPAATAAAYGVNAAITGKVSDAEGKPVIGVSVFVKGTKKGTTTNSAGEFSIDANKGDVLVFSAVNYATQEVLVGDNTSLNVTLALSNAQMSEIFVTALGIRKESKRLGYAVSKVDGEVLTKAREINVANGLEGRVAGLNVSGVSGGPGSSANIIIRGVTSFSGGGPLFVINGIPMDNTTRGSAGEWGGADLGDGISNINPDDIEEISVLKGSTASALYGSRAANGVIIITTKSGKNKKGIGVELNSNLVFDKVIDYSDFQYTYGQGLLGVKPANQAAAYQSGGSSWGAKIDNSSVVQFDGVSRPYTAHPDNIKNFYQTGSTLTNTLAFSGGNDNSNFRFSASNLMNKSVVPNSELSRNTFNLTVNSKVTRRLALAILANYIVDKSQNRPNLSDSPGNSNFGITFLPTTLDEKVLRPGNTPDGNEINFSDNVYVTNPWFAANKFENNLSRNRLISMASLKYNFTDWLSLMGRVGQDYFSDRTTSVTPTGTAYYPAGNMSENANKSTELNADFLLNAQRNISKDFAVDASLGGNVRKSRYELLNSTGDQFSVPFLYVLNNAKNKNSNYQLYRQQVNSLYYTLEFSYKSFLYLNTTGREDWFSTLPTNNNHLFYPSVSGSFIITQLLHASWLDFAKARLAWANTSGATSPYQTKLYYSIAGSINGYPIGIINNSSVPNSELEPFRLQETEAGLEGRLLKNRLFFDVAWFNRKTIKEIVQVPASITSGYSGATLNFGQMENKGIELMVGGTPVKVGEFTWTTSFNITKIKNKILQLAEGQSTQPKDESRSRNAFIHHVVGLPASQVMAFDYKRDAKGEIVFDNNGLPEQGDLIPMGSGYHDVFGGWDNQFNFKGFNLGVLIDFKSGGKIFSATNYYATLDGLGKNTLDGRETGIVGKGVNESGAPNTVNAKAWDYYNALASRVSSQFVYDASFIKLRQVVLGYTLPQKWFGKLPIQGVNISLVGRNLAILKKHTPNIDPESNYNNTIAQGLELAGVPPYRSFGINLSCKL